MENAFSRTELLLGKEAMNLLKNKHVAIFGLGGVGGYVAEALIRTGVGKFTLVDNDVVSLSNLNRQIISTHETVGKYKTEVMKARMLSINPQAVVNTIRLFVLPNTINQIDFSQFDYVVDAIDTVKGKLAIITQAKKFNVPIISSMGTGNKLNPMGFVVTDINKTEMDPLAKVIRTELRKMGIKKLKVVYSKEQPIDATIIDENNRRIPGSNAFVPSAAGLLIASEVIRDLISQNE